MDNSRLVNVKIPPSLSLFSFVSMSTPRRTLLTFALITTLFALWGFANDITNPMVAAFKTSMEISNFEAAFVQFAFYGGYATMAIPAALFVRRFSYKAAILFGLLLYAIGAFLFIPAAERQQFSFFCLSLYILTFGLAFLETTANPFIMSLGSRETATRRLNLAQAFNPIGSLTGMIVASQLVLNHLWSNDEAVSRRYGVDHFSLLPTATKAVIRQHDLDTIRDPYVVIGLVVVGMMIAIALFVHVERQTRQTHSRLRFLVTVRALFRNRVYREGVVAQLFYVAAQIMCWTFIIQYAGRLGIEKDVAQWWNIGAMALFLCGRFVGTYLMRRIPAPRLLFLFAIGAMATTSCTILIDGLLGLVALVLTSLFMSIMFPTIYGIALGSVNEETSLGASFLVMAIVGGAIMPPLQGAIIDLDECAPQWFQHPSATNLSFLLPLLCFLIIARYGYKTSRL